MSRSRVKLTDRVLAILLSFLMIIAMIPVTTLQAQAATAEHPDSYTVSVTDGTDMISDATVTLRNTEYGLDLSATTDIDGVAAFESTLIEAILPDNSIEKITVEVRVSKDGYDNYLGQTDIEIANMTTDLPVTLTKTEVTPQQATVSVSVSGDATVEINGVVQNSATVDSGTEVPVKITPAEGSYIKVLTVGGETVNVTKGEAYEGTVKADADVAILATVVKEFTVTAPAVSGGAITLNGGRETSISVDENTKVTVGVTADEGYQISSVVIGGAAQTLDNDATFTKEITVTANTEIAVVFTKVYTITVIHNENGTVVTDPVTTGGAVAVVEAVENSEITITADPDDNYRVSEVKINDIKETIGDANYGPEDKYIKKLTVDNKDYTVVITFAPNRYKVTAADTKNGSVNIESGTVDYNGSTKVTLLPDAGYTVESVKVNGADVEPATTDDSIAYFLMEGIVEDKKVVATFKKPATVDMSNVRFNTINALRANLEGTLYVFANGATVTFGTDKSGIRIYDINDSEVGGGWNEQSVAISRSTSIGRISLFYKAEGEWIPTWHDVPTVTKNNPLNIVIDNTAPEFTLTPAEANVNGYYNSDVDVEISAVDKGDYSGIATVEYWITSGGEETKRETIYTYNAGEEIRNTYNAKIIVNASENDNDAVVVHVKVTDRAGNVTETTDETAAKLKINATPPSVSVKINGELHPEATTGKYNTARTATVTYIDRDTTFNADAANDGIEISAKDASGKEVSIVKQNMIKWDHNGDTHTATIEFVDDANYEWSVSYTNNAGLSVDKIDAEGDSVYSFAVDKAAPKEVKITLDGSEWTELISKLTFGLFKNYNATAVATGFDATTGSCSIVYYKSNEETALTVSQLDRLYKEGKFSEETITVSADERVVVYARITDLAGNTTYISTNGVIYDTTKSTIEINPPAANENGYYNKDVVIPISVNDVVSADTAYSGIKTITYKVEKEEKTEQDKVKITQTQGGELYKFDIENLTYDQLKAEWSGNITVDSQKNNSDDVKVTVKVTDNAGNEYEESVTLDINIDKPTAVIDFTDTANKDVDGHGYYGEARTATIIINDRGTSFDAEAATKGITFSAVDAKGKTIELTEADVKIKKWSSSGDQHTTTVTFNKDGNYTWSFAYTNKAGNKMEKIGTVASDSPYSFTVDKTDPTGTVTINTNTWDKLLEVLTFGWYSNVKADVTATADDDTSPVIVEYFETDNPIAMTAEELDKETFEAYKDYSVENDRQFVVYLKITDYAGNYTYINSNGYIVDKVASKIILTPSAANGFYDAKAKEKGQYGLYNRDSDVIVDIGVEDAELYSGIKSVEYWIENNSVKTQGGNLFTFDVTNPAQSDLVNKWSDSITVDKELNNSCNIVVYVKTVDNAGNEETESVKLDIDNTAPTIDVTFDNNADNNGNTYFNAQRTATIVITERNHHFDADAATKGIIITAVNAKGETVENAYTLSSWTTVENTEDPDKTTHTATIFFEKDANYTWSIAYTDKAGNANNGVNIANSVAPFDFTVDKTDPTGTVTVDTNTWDKLLEVLTFGWYSNVKADVTATADDDTSPVTIEYFETDNPIVMTAEELDKETFKPYRDYSVENDRQFVVYLKITDYAGNYIYINSDGCIVDKVASKITLTPSAANGFYDAKANEKGQYGLYNKDSDVTVDIKVEDAEPYSGIKSVEYWIENNNVKTQGGNLFTFDVTNPVQSDLVKEWSDSITVDKKLYNSCNVVVYVKTVDNAGNETIEFVKLDIDNTAPTIDVTFDNNADNNGNTYFNAQRTATIVITERNHHFDAEAATAGVIVNAVNAKGEPVENAYTLSAWTPAENAEDPDKTTHTATLFFEKDANYTWSIAYTDKAGNANNGINIADSVAPFDFTVDTVAPTGTIKATSAEGRETEWASLRDELTFGFWSKENIKITSTAIDATSAPVAAVEYYKVQATAANDGITALSWEELDGVTTWTNFEGLEIVTDEQFTVYLKITDLAGNYRYISTNGLIVDHTAPMEETIAPEITVEPQQPINGLYNGDVKVAIKVTDPLTGGTYSGLKTVAYRVLNMGVETQKGTLYAFENKDPKQSDLLQTWTGEITVDSALNNSNDVVVVISAKDNALNGNDDEVAIKIDVTDPTIDVTYDNNNADNAKYFKADRTATIVVTERNFNANDVKVTIENTDDVIPTIGEWTKMEGTGNLDDTRWITTVTYNADGDYTFDIAYTDLADNACAGARYGDSVAPTEFTVDKTLPVVSVSYNNNSARNGKYFAAPRTATVVVTEHNFDVNRVVFTQTAGLNGAGITIPAASWGNNGDIHTATIVFDRDGDYTFDVAVTDMAANVSEPANYGNSVAGKDFVIDQTIEKPIIGGVANGGAYKEDVIPTISFNDVNYDSYEVKLLRTRMGEKNVDVTAEFIEGITEQGQGGSGIYDTFEKIVENDGIYTLIVRMVDKAGNEETEEYTFTVNRFGSVYEYSDELVALIKDGGQYVTSVDNDLVITEYNADRILEDSLKILITRDGETVDVDFTSNPANINAQVGIGESGWYQYTYTIKASNFEQDGVYKISLSSEYFADDSEKNESTSVPENSIDEAGGEILDTMSFTVDSVAPEIRNIVNLDKAIVNAQTVDVKYTVVDVGGLKSIEVMLNGKAIDTITEFGDSAFNYSGQFTINESSDAQSVQIKVTDLAGNVTDTAAEDFDTGDLYVFNDKITVSTNIFVRWYANKPLFWGSIGGVIVVIGAIWFIIAFKRKKKEESK